MGLAISDFGLPAITRNIGKTYGNDWNRISQAAFRNGRDDGETGMKWEQFFGFGFRCEVRIDIGISFRKDEKRRAFDENFDRHVQGPLSIPPDLANREGTASLGNRPVGVRSESIPPQKHRPASGACCPFHQDSRRPSSNPVERDQHVKSARSCLNQSRAIVEIVKVAGDQKERALRSDILNSFDLNF